MQGNEPRNKALSTAVEEAPNSGIPCVEEAHCQNMECSNENDLPDQEHLMPRERNFESMIDKVARFMFPLVYFTFITVYFALNLALP